jgi:hypothetical protein
MTKKKYAFHVDGKVGFYLDKLNVIANTKKEAVEIIKDSSDDLDLYDYGICDDFEIENIELLSEEEYDGDEEDGIIG